VNNKFKKLRKDVELRNARELLAPRQGMTLLNSNGDVDTSTLGYQYTTQTVTQIRAQVISQKFYKVAIADFMPVVIGTGAWMEEIKTNLVYDVAGGFESGIQGTSAGPAQISEVDVATAPINAKITTWAKGYRYTTPEVQKALAALNWDVISSKMAALKRQWDLGIQKVAFLGLLTDLTNTPGLLTNASVNINTSRITANINTLSSSAFATLVAGILSDYFANSNNTTLPNTFVIPMDDYLGLTTPVASGFPIVSMMTYLLQAFKEATGNPNFKIHGLAYSTAANNAGYINGATGKQRYVLYNNESETLKMDIPVDFVLTPAGTANNFQWQGVGAGQLTGCIVYRPAEVLYFDHN
jgi:hypothetical protein